MRIIVYGAGAIGGVIGARLFQHEHDVVLIARGANYAALSKEGIRLETPDESVLLRVPVVDNPHALTFRESDVVVMAMKTQDTQSALLELSQCAPRGTTLVCAQNGVENERLSLRLFENVYGVCVICPSTHLTAGVVQASSSPVTGLMDVGRWPQGTDQRALEIAAMFSEATFDSIARDDIPRWKWGKLLMNLGNAVEAVCGTASRDGELVHRAIQEGIDVLGAARIAFVDAKEDAARRGTLMSLRPISGTERSGGSSWQSLMRATGAIETDYLTGEIVLQGRLHGVRTPVNALLQELANRLAAQRRAPGAFSEDEVLRLLEA